MDGHEDECIMSEVTNDIFWSREDYFKSQKIPRRDWPAREMDNEDPSGGVWRYTEYHSERSEDGSVISLYEWCNPEDDV